MRFYFVGVSLSHWFLSISYKSKDLWEVVKGGPGGCAVKWSSPVRLGGLSDACRGSGIFLYQQPRKRGWGIAAPRRNRWHVIWKFTCSTNGCLQTTVSGTRGTPWSRQSSVTRAEESSRYSTWEYLVRAAVTPAIGAEVQLLSGFLHLLKSHLLS